MPEAVCTERDILFFSRGKGRGHAIPDAAIANELRRLEPSVNVTFASYSVGAATLRELGYHVIDLGLPEDNSLWEALLRMVPLLRCGKPELVVSHEEFCVPPLSRAFGVRNVFVTDWFANPDSMPMQSLKYADQVLFLEAPGIYDEPPCLAGKVLYVGYVLGAMEGERIDKAQARGELGLPQRSTVILVCPGGSEMHSESRSPLFDLVLAAYSLLDAEDKRLLWVTDEPDYSALLERSRDRRDVLVLRPHFRFAPTILAADLVITKGNRLPLFECEVRGIPSISISYGHNPVDDYRVSHIRTNSALRARGLTNLILRDYMVNALSRNGGLDTVPRPRVESHRLVAAQALRSQLQAYAQGHSAIGSSGGENGEPRATDLHARTLQVSGQQQSSGATAGASPSLTAGD